MDKNEQTNEKERSLATVPENSKQVSGDLENEYWHGADTSIVHSGSDGQLEKQIEHIAFDEVHDDSMSGGYATVNGKHMRSRDKKLWIAIIIMSVVCVVVGVCSSLITAYFMRYGVQPSGAGVGGNVQQNIADVVDKRKRCIAEVECAGVNGSGVVMKFEGGVVYILTNTHVVARYVDNSRAPTVRFYGEDFFYEGHVIGYDEHYDIAVIGVRMNLADKRAYEIINLDGSEFFSPTTVYYEGDYVVSIGNAMSMGLAVYDGIISRKSELLQCNELFSDKDKTVPVMRTTAAINAGMSGGALFDMAGNFIGLGTYRMSNSAGVDKDGSSNTDVEDTGFVTPVSVVYAVYKRILAEGNGGAVPLLPVTEKRVRTSAIGWLGLPFGFNCEYELGKLKVVTLDDGTPSTQVKVGDIITKIGDTVVTDNICNVIGALLCYKRGGSGRELKITLDRGGDAVTITIAGYGYAI